VCSLFRSLLSAANLVQGSTLPPAGLRDRIWWGAGSNATAIWAAKLEMNLQSSTLKNDETGEAFLRLVEVSIPKLAAYCPTSADRLRYPMGLYLGSGSAP
jgi:hypothetical protein